jgi:hypothetical protein
MDRKNVAPPAPASVVRMRRSTIVPSSAIGTTRVLWEDKVSRITFASAALNSNSGTPRALIAPGWLFECPASIAIADGFCARQCADRANIVEDTKQIPKAVLCTPP